MKNLRHNNGITLVALVITIIILLILVGIAISQLTNSGLFNNTQTAKEKYSNSQEREDSILKEYENIITTGEINSSRDTVTISTDEYTRLLNSSNSTNLSSDEKVIGTWIDGKKLYQKTIELALTKDNSKSYAHNIANVDKIYFDASNSFLCNNDYTSFSNFFNIGVGSSDAAFVNSYLCLIQSVNKTNINIRAGSDNTLTKAFITLRYTKTENSNQ